MKDAQLLWRKIVVKQNRIRINKKTAIKIFLRDNNDLFHNFFNRCRCFSTC